MLEVFALGLAAFLVVVAFFGAAAFVDAFFGAAFLAAGALDAFSLCLDVRHDRVERSER